MATGFGECEAGYKNQIDIFCNGSFVGYRSTLFHKEAEVGEKYRSLAQNFYEQVYLKEHPNLIFQIKMPFVRNFIIVDNTIYTIDYDDDYNWHIYDKHDLLKHDYDENDRYKYNWGERHFDYGFWGDSFYNFKN